MPVLEMPSRQIRNLPEEYIKDAVKQESMRLYEALIAIDDKITLYNNGDYIGDSNELIQSIQRLARISMESDYYASLFRKQLESDSGERKSPESIW